MFEETESIASGGILSRCLHFTVTAGRRHNYDMITSERYFRLSSPGHIRRPSRSAFEVVRTLPTMRGVH